MIESDSPNAAKWARGVKRPLWRLITLAREIKELASDLEVSFVQISRSANGVADFFAKYDMLRLLSIRRPFGSLPLVRCWLALVSRVSGLYSFPFLQ